MNKIRKLLSLLLAAMMLLSLAACGNQTAAPATEAPASEPSPAEPAVTEPAPEAVETPEPLTMRGDEFGNGAIGEHGAVSSFSAATSQVGIDILAAGGNAVDAAVATIFAVGVCEPHHSGIGGSGLMTIYLADTDEYTTIEYMEALPLKYDGTYRKVNDNDNARGAAVPGQVAGLLYALEKYGTMTPAQVLEPAIRLAREGFELDFVVAGAIADAYATFAQPGYEYLLELFTDFGIPYSAGDLFINEDLANTLEIIADKGADGFYTGEVAEKLVAGLQAGGNWITMEDLASYKPVERKPVVTDYYGYQVVACPYPTAGGIWELESLNIMESMDIAQYEQGSPEYWEVFNEAVRVGAYDAYYYFGDQDKYELPIAALISQEYADERAALLGLDGCIVKVPDSNLGDPNNYGIKESTSVDEGTSTTHIAVMDASGNVVSSTNTVGYSFGCLTAVEGLGFVLNNHMLNNKNVEPGGHIKSSMSPTIVTKDGSPVMAVGSPGSRVIPCAVMSVINNVLLYDMTVQEAINAPRCFILDYDGNKPLTSLTAETGRLSSALIRRLEIFGYDFTEGVSDYDMKCGGVAAIYVNPDDGLIYAGGDHRREYQALAY